MLKIFKFPIPPQPIQGISLPIGAQVLCVQAQRNQPFLWVLCPTGVKMEDRSFATYTTGGEITDDWGSDRKYIGTYQLDGGAFVGHVFELITQKTS